VFNYRVARVPTAPGPTEAAGPDEAPGPDGTAGPARTQGAPPRPVVRPVREPQPRSVPMWAQFGDTPLFALVTEGDGFDVTAVYDEQRLAAVTVAAMFGAYQDIMRTIADGDTSATVGRLRSAARQ
jgi:hypothetical protein